MEPNGIAMEKVEVMTQAKARRLSRGMLLLAAGLLMAVMGDRGVLTATSRGIDPLEILNLQVKPNIIVVFDSSGSMRESPAGGNRIVGEVNYALMSGDWSGSKMFQAKQVLSTVIAANDDKASFLFGRYTQQNSSFRNTGAGADRFSYTTQAWITSAGPPTVYGGPSLTMPATPLTLQWEPVVINAQSNVFYYNEVSAALATATTPLVSCPVTLPNGIYATAAEHDTLATAIAGAMNGCTTGRYTTPNTYSVAWNPGTRRFTIRRTNNSDIHYWQVIVGGTNGAANSIGFTVSTALAANATVLTTAPAARGFQAFQDIQGGWNMLYFRVTGQSSCSVAIATGTYLSGAALAAEMQSKMNACPSLGGNLFNVTYLANAGTFRFDRRSGGTFSMLWAPAANSISAVLTAGTADTASDTSSTTGAAPRHLRRSQFVETTFSCGGNQCGTGDFFTETYDPDGANTGVGSTTVYTYRLFAGRFWSGQTLNVTPDGTFCGFGTTSPVNPPGVSLQQVSACGGAAVGSPVFFEFAGGQFGGNDIGCNGFSTRVPLNACDSATLQITAINPYLQREIPLDANGNLVGYVESTDGAYSVTTSPPAGPPTGGGMVADGATPIAASLANIKTLFDGLWTTGQAVPALTPISSHSDPKERTIVLFVTDGNDTCDGVLVAANNAQRLYYPIVGGLNSNGTFTTGTDRASSVSTYMVGYGKGPSATLLNYIAWGGSGLGAQMCPANNCATWAANPTTTQRANCTTCVDAYIAPDAGTLATVIDSIINQGATFGDYTAQGSLIQPIYEYVGEVPPSGGTTYDPFSSVSRYTGVVPLKFKTVFSMPDFQGHVYAINSDLTNRWDAGAKLTSRVQQGMASCPATNGASAGEGTFASIAAGSGNCSINRRIYSTSQNGVFAAAATDLTSPTWVQTNGNRTPIWPPSTAVNPASGNGILDAALGLPMTDDVAAWDTLTTTYKACLGTPLPTACASASDATRVPAARKEARQIILAYMAGAKVALDSTGAAPKRKTSGSESGALLFKARTWALGESTLADSAIVGPPIEAIPNGVYSGEYKFFRDGFKDSSGQPTDNLLAGFGLKNPDVDASGVDASPSLVPVMSVIYVAANDMLHAFRAGSSILTTSQMSCVASATVECGGEELWGFVPFDQLGKLKDLMKPQTRDSKAYVMASPVRFSDVFVPNPGTTSNPSGSLTFGGQSLPGVWRKVLIVGRGIAGKYYTALDVTAPGPFTALTTASTTQGPVVYWSRGNPDTDTGLPSGSPGTTLNHDTADYLAYSRMGETWSVPAIGYVNKVQSARKPCAGGGTPGLPCSDQSGGGVEFLAFAGSGYSDVVTEGTTFFSLDVLTGDVVASADVGSRVPGPVGGYVNALVANAVSYAPNQFQARQAGHPFDASAKTSRVYIGDLHGRLWKFLASALTTPILFQDLGADQPVGTPVALIKLPPTIPPDFSGSPHVFVVTGNDTRATIGTGQFRYYGFRDTGGNNDTTPPSNPTSCIPTLEAPCLFWGEFTDSTDPTLGGFRGTVQAATVFEGEDAVPMRGRVFLVGTRFVPPSGSVLSTPPYPCRSRFDSVVFALGAVSGNAAYDLNAAGDDKYVVFDNSRLVAASIVTNPTLAGGANLFLDEGIYNPAVPEQPPPSPGPTPILGSSVATGSSITGSTVCK